MSREYARRSKGGGNLPLIIAIIGTVIVIAVIIYFLVSGSGGGGLFNKTTATPIPTPTMEQTPSPTPGPTPSPEPSPTVIVVIPSESPTDAVIATPAPTPTPQKTYASAKVWANSLNVREGAGLEYAKIATVKRGDVFKVVEETSKFLKIQLSGGGYGWVWRDYCVRGDSALPAAPTSAPDPSFMTKAELTTSTNIKITFSENVWGDKAKTANVPAASFEVKEGTSTVAISAISDCAGGTFVNLTIGATSGGELKVTLKENGVYNDEGEGTPAGTITLGSSGDSVAPTASFSGGTSTKTITVTFSENVYSTSSGSDALDATDFVLTGEKSVSLDGVAHTAGSKTATITFSFGVAMAQNDTAICTLTLKSSSAYDAAGNACAQSPYNFTYKEP